MISGFFKSCNFRKYKTSFTLSSENSNRDGSASSLPTFDTSNIPIALKMDGKVIVAHDSSNVYVSDFFKEVVL